MQAEAYQIDRARLATLPSGRPSFHFKFSVVAVSLQLWTTVFPFGESPHAAVAAINATQGDPIGTDG